jgi:hypothetical protein
LATPSQIERTYDYITEAFGTALGGHDVADECTIGRTLPDTTTINRTLAIHNFIGYSLLLFRFAAAIQSSAIDLRLAQA